MSARPGPRPTTRRPFLAALVGGAAAVAGIGVAARNGVLSGSSEGPPRTDGVLQLSAGRMGVESLAVRLTDEILALEEPGTWRTSRLATSTHTMVGFTWRSGEVEPHIDVSSRTDGAWQPWSRMPHVHHSPDADSGEATGIVGTELAWIGPADGIRLRIRDSRPAGLTMVLLHPTPLPSDRSIGHARVGRRRTRRAGGEPASTPAGVVPPPDLLSRAQWGADEGWRKGRPSYVETIEQVHVHHTANSNTYARTDVPALIRGMYAYHTQSLGWSDIAYNFLVDRFGRAWVGRAGGPAKPVRGAHTLGFNATSAGIAAIGNFDQATPSRAVLGAFARIAAWKLHPYDRNPEGRTIVTSEGSDKFRAGRRVTLPVIDGHRDTNDTACPGQHLYDELPEIRRRTQVRIDRFNRAGQVEITEPFTAAGTPVDGELLTVSPGAWAPAAASAAYTWMRDGEPLGSAATADRRLSTDDVGAQMTVRVDLTAEGYEPASQVVTFPDPVRSRTRIDVAAVGRRGRAVVRVTIETPGLDVPFDDSVTITFAGHSRTVAATDGRARVVFRDLAPGRYEARVDFAGGPTAAGASATDTATVRPSG
ncbi:MULTISPECIES: N-acetylmuramoyl-L-alanine amidase [unclassified Nocardioides]|uniref:N-acetylmuramoyl-L-alanine amidase n=1 Tax=unclassified Nocardioides TaxID=2615069 RepID=UPI0000EB6388|nr:MULTISPECIES: N-acetylmuramoyl-L-alanine amidase [unclassified Nocardioides]ABL83289.1 N-acetylmuramoyl-L-alanine amidase, family 2 [Nocardioides sp. JS614]